MPELNEGPGPLPTDLGKRIAERIEEHLADADAIVVALNRIAGSGWTRNFAVVSGPDAPVEAVIYPRLTTSPSGRRVLSGLLLLAEDTVTSELLRRVPIAAMENTHNPSQQQSPPEHLPPLRRAGGMSAVEFSHLVAQHYKAWAAIVPHPAAAMAEHARANPATVYSWIREARLRGFLPPATRGKRAAS